MQGEPIRAAGVARFLQPNESDAAMFRGLLLWLIGLPIPIIILLWLFGFLS